MTPRILRTLCVALAATALTVAARPAAAQISVIVSAATPKTSAGR